MIGRFWDKVLYKLCRSVPPYSETAVHHIGSKAVSVTDRHTAYLIRRCEVWPRYSVAYKNCVVRETVKCPDRTEYVYESLKKYPRIDISGAVTTIGDLWPLNYYHKFVDMIPKLYGLHHEEFRGEDVTLVLDERFTEEDLTIIRALAPDNVQTRRVSSMRRIVCDAYIHLPRLSTDPQKPCKNLSGLGFLPADYLAFYRRKLAEAFGIRFDAGKPSRRVFISRKDASKRRMVNEDEVVQVLETYGFERVALERLDLVEQMQLFAGASFVVGQHGAGLTNLLYVPKETKVIEIFSSSSTTPPHYASAVDLLDLRYLPVHMQPVGADTKDADGRLAIEDLERALQQFETVPA